MRKMGLRRTARANSGGADCANRPPSASVVGTMRLPLALLTVLGFLLLASPVFAGANDAELSCKGKAKDKTSYTLEGMVPHDSDTFILSLKDGKGREIHSWDYDSSYGKVWSVSRIVDKLLVLEVHKGPFFQLVAIPKTVKVKKGKGGHGLDATFKADVRSIDGKRFFGLQMRCNYHYSV